MRGLYAIIDTESLARARLDVLRFADAVMSARPAALQLRDKRRDSRDQLRLLEALVTRSTAAGVPLFANDRADLALIAGCDGVHVGQHDLHPSEVRRLSREAGREGMRIGMSVHDPEELTRALLADVDYIALGPVYGTRSKANPEPTLGVGGLRALAARARASGPWPRVAIGGITAGCVAEIRPFCEMVAVISALVDANHADPYQHAADQATALQQALGGEAA